MIETPAILKASFLWDGINEDPVSDGAVLIEDGLIKKVGAFSDLLTSSEIRILEFPDATLLPGLIDRRKGLPTDDQYLERMSKLCDEIFLLSELGTRFHQALREVTINAARDLGIEAQTGSLVPGKRADIIVVAGNPLRNLHVLRAIQFVMKRGKVLHPASYRLLMEENLTSEY
ncbi:MAG: amidohydrolase family protein [Bacteroidota bacterium]|nr:amidohydrolase family protein [Bacteroidota bacterium]